MTKSDITNSLKTLEKHGYKVITFNHYKAMPKGATGFIDHIILSTTGTSIWFLEVKIGKDRESDKQREFREVIERFERKNKAIHYRQVSEVNLADTITEIYGK